MTFYLFRNTVNNCRLPGALFTNRDTFILYLIVNLKRQLFCIYLLIEQNWPRIGHTARQLFC